MSVNPNFFMGTVEGQPFVAAQAFGGAQSEAGMAVDMLTPLNGTRTPEFNENNWLLRPVDPSLPPERAKAVLATTGEVHEVGAVTPREVARYAGQAAVEQVFHGR